jgi:hypothetical protein
MPQGVFVSDGMWKRICDVESLNLLRSRLDHEDVDHLMTLTHHAGGPFLPGPFAGFDSSKTTQMWYRDVNTDLITELAFIGVHWFVPPENLPLVGFFDSLNRVSLFESQDSSNLAARCSMLGQRIVHSIPGFPFICEDLA